MCRRCCPAHCFSAHWRSWLRPLVMACYGVMLIVVLPLLIIRLQQLGAHPHDQAWFIGGIFVLLTLPISIWEITQHLVYYTKPHLQKHIIRILWMVPIYALTSWLGLLYPKAAIYLDTCRECYEAYVIYNFMMFLLNYLHVERGLEESLAIKPPVKHFFPCCCLSPWQMGRSLNDRCKHGILQYTVIRPITTVIALICEIIGVYGEGEFRGTVAYPYLVAVNNVSQFVAMYSLILFYKAHLEELAPMNPLSKFLCIKAVVFFAFFQSVIISILVNTGVISESFTTKDDKVVKAVASSLQDFLICIEMFIASLVHLYAFSHKPYLDPTNEPPSCWHSFLAMWDVSDVRLDVSSHFRAVGSTVQRSVVRSKPVVTSDAADERTRLLQPTQQGMQCTTEPSQVPETQRNLTLTVEEREFLTMPWSHPTLANTKQTSSDSEDDDRGGRGASWPRENSLIDVVKNANC